MILKNTAVCEAKFGRLTSPQKGCGGILEGEPQPTLTRPWMPTNVSIVQGPLKIFDWNQFS